MAAFRFPLQKVLELRERQEQASALQLVQARREAEEANQARLDLEAAREAGRVRLAQAHGAGSAVGHLQNLAYVVDRVDEKIRDAEDACRKADENVAVSTKGFHDALKQRRTMDQLRGRHLDQWKSDQVRQERKTMDEVAITRHGRADRAAASVRK